MSELPVVDCVGCGVCCLHMGFPAFNLTLDQLTNADQLVGAALSAAGRADLGRWQRMPEALRDHVLELMRGYRPLSRGELDGPCEWFDVTTRQCRHHEHRPQVCRDFQVGGKGCIQWRSEFPELNGSI